MDKFRQRALNDKTYMEYISDIYNDSNFAVMDKYEHHNTYTRLDHCIHVSYSTYLWLKKLAPGYRYMREACRGALLHDFFLYEWHTENPFPVPCMHAWKHPERAYLDAKKYFNISPVEKHIILTHMYPLYLGIPSSKAAWMVIWFDKYWACREGFRSFSPLKMLRMQVPDSLKKKRK